MLEALQFKIPGEHAPVTPPQPSISLIKACNFGFAPSFRKTQFVPPLVDFLNTALPTALYCLTFFLSWSARLFLDCQAKQCL